ncbi:MAG: hypothetical protein A2622_02565 [Bdellovibrionales bacterium RIFCSPHIGHO2_01_FULL_40_29]|nr:MAG: hypothetical protein A2622_02565 [Bdellovibrionales bacterium RIFCSPHIGHO2_01_FULL_40_29]OFZ33964.1 MAG: hypothetical protein A3D17_02985 [Bdellovibrionales bacterium RIFCSPHIGHO2_02_FULL_40_15]
MEKYYVAHNGIQKGPWELSEISLKLASKELGWNDYIYDQKTEDWVLLLEFSALTESFNKSFKNPIVEPRKVKAIADPEKDRAWYILKQNNNYGPFSKNEMIQMLQSKTLFEYDFVWRKDQDSWKRLAEIPEFSPEQIKSLYHSWDGDQDGEIFFRRRHARAHYSSSLVVHDRKKVFKAESMEISAGGAGLTVTNINFSIDQELYVHFRPSDQVPAFNAVCKVVSKSGDKYGIQFLTISAIAKDSISRYTAKAA